MKANDGFSFSVALYLLLAALLVYAGASYADDLRGQVVGVLDGDTIDVLTADKERVRVRLAGIDAPEKSQAFGSASKRHLSDLVYGKNVSVEWHKRDRYGRVVGKVRCDGVDVDLEMVKAGFAWHYIKYTQEQMPSDRTAYADAQVAAREQRRGLWQDGSAKPPWDFRRAR